MRSALVEDAPGNEAESAAALRARILCGRALSWILTGNGKNSAREIQKNYQRALEDCDRALACPGVDQRVARTYRAQALAFLFRRAEARAEARRALTSPRRQVCLTRLESVFLSAGAPAEALACAKESLRQGDRSDRVVFYAGLAAIGCGAWQEARELLAKVNPQGRPFVPLALSALGAPPPYLPRLRDWPRPTGTLVRHFLGEVDEAQVLREAVQDEERATVDLLLVQTLLGIRDEVLGATESAELRYRAGLERGKWLPWDVPAMIALARLEALEDR